LVSATNVGNKRPLKDFDDDALQEVLVIHTLRLFEERALRRTSGPKREEGTGAWKELNNVELHNMYTSPNISTYLLTYLLTELSPS
jgi:hypothetical protein